MEQFTSILIPILTIVSTVAAALTALLLGSLKTLRASNADLRDSNRDLKERVQTLEAELHAEQDKTAVLTEMVTGTNRLSALEEAVTEQSELLSEHHHEAVATWTMMLQALNRNRP